MSANHVAAVMHAHDRDAQQFHLYSTSHFQEGARKCAFKKMSLGFVYQ